MANEVWGEVYDRLEELILAHKTTLIFVNTRRMAERVAAALAERLGDNGVTSHHGSLAKEHRLDAEQRLKQGQLKALVATASLELGLDIGDVDLVCQLGSPKAISTLLQRVGRSGHRLKAIPKGRLFPLSRDDLVECTAMLAAISRGELDAITLIEQPLDVLAQQIVAEIASQEWSEQGLYQVITKAWPYRGLSYEQFIDVVKMLADGFHTRRGRRSAYLHRDAVHGQLRARKNARLTALINGGAIPDQFDYDVIMQPEGLFVGTLNEDFAFESLPGDIFQLGNTSYRMLKIEQGRVFVEDAHGLPPTIPFWFGESPGRTDELSVAVSQFRAELDKRLEQGLVVAERYLQQELALPLPAAEQLLNYLAAGKAALSQLPTQQVIVFERFFDEVGDTHLVIHAPFGSRINRAWGLALRKRFCRQFNFELQAAANEDCIILSLSATHSFPLIEPAHYLKAASVRQVLIQALLAAPMFATRWRWVANISLAIPRNRAGKKVPAYFQRNDAEDLIAVIFPDQLACFENIPGDRQVPEHPLVNQVLADCLNDLMDITGLEQLLARIEQGQISVITRELTQPSALAQEILNARPYAFLDDTPAEERRTLAVKSPRTLDIQSAADSGQLRSQAIEQVRLEAWPKANTSDELHDALVILGFITEAEALAQHWQTLLTPLINSQRATVMQIAEDVKIWVAAERLQTILWLHADAPLRPVIKPVLNNEANDMLSALTELMRSRLEGLGPVTATALAASINAPVDLVEQALLRLQQQGYAMQGRYTQTTLEPEWCERGLLARMHRLSLQRLRAEIEPVSSASFMRFLFAWQRISSFTTEDSLEQRLLQLEGISAPASAWEQTILPARIKPYSTLELDQLCSSGRLLWLKLISATPNPTDKPKKPIAKTTAINFIPRASLAHWRYYAPMPTQDGNGLSATAAKLFNALKAHGASFIEDLQAETGLLSAQLTEALSELVANGLISADHYQGLRTLIVPESVQHRKMKRYRGYQPFSGVGRWFILRAYEQDRAKRHEHAEYIAKVLLRRYGVVFRKLLEAEDIVPTWQDLLYVYRRLEARGEVRGGRFVQGFAGEQFALPEAINQLKSNRDLANETEFIVLSSADPLNLTGIITPGKRLPAQSKYRILYKNGVPIAYAQQGRVEWLTDIAETEQWQFKQWLLRMVGRVVQ
ncbi:DEAD/DEAH box helicase [Methylocucumis oryzae]|uniref:DEAD/DEAH box helicase n=1 Tax=Methylocucumis oryzae TaxID=1632867 RepID=UPI000AD8D64E|nr:helicase-related protein [Methylocucumis oryzae]